MACNVLVVGLLLSGGRSTCPPQLPVLYGEASAAPCNASADPAIQYGDAPCSYDACAADSASAQCWCVDYTLVGGSSALWECVHSRCRCFGREGEPCGISWRGALFDPHFRGGAAVAGSGCTLDSKNGVVARRTGCLCGAATRNEWVWQCTGTTLPTSVYLTIGVSLLGALLFALCCLGVSARHCKKHPRVAPFRYAAVPGDELASVVEEK